MRLTRAPWESAIVAAAAYELRVALFLLFFLMYFGGYPAIQFAARHYFHLEFITLGALGLLLQGLLVRRGERDRGDRLGGK